MKKIIYLYILVLSALVPASLLAQPSNDECTSATVVTLAVPAACPTGSTTGFHQGATSTLTNQTNVNATSSAPYPYLHTCPVNISNTPLDVWYSFVATGAQTTISVSNATGTLTNPVISMWGGTCNSYLGLGCSSGSGGAASLTVYQTIIGRTYYIQVAGQDSTQKGTFTLKIACANNCAGCLQQSYITPSPMPNNGGYAPGQTVQFCFTVSLWDQGNANWLHGVRVSYGSGWDPASLVITGTPASCTNTAGAFWQYYPAGQTSSFTGNYFGPGFYYETTAGSTSGVIDNNSGNNFGDQDAGLGICSPTFCIQLTAYNTDTPGSDLSVNFATSGDGQSGSWSSVACGIDPGVSFNNVSSCIPPRMKSLTAGCNLNNGADTARLPGRYYGPYVFQWSNGVRDSTADTISVISNLAPGVYTVTVTNALGCVSIGRDTVKSAGPPNGGPNQYLSCTSSLDSVVMAAAGSGTWTTMAGNPASVLIHHPDSANTTISGFSVPGTYNFIWTVVACSDTVSVIVTSRPDAGPDTITCVNTPATMNAVGSGTWTAVPTNPAVTTIQNPTDPHTTITGFTVGGTYQFVWTQSTCHDTTVVTVPLFTLTAVGDTVLCKGLRTTISASAGPAAQGPYTYQWLNTGQVQSPNSATTVINPLQNTTDFIVKVTSSNGCILYDTVRVRLQGVTPQITITPSNTQVCPGDVVNLNTTILVSNLVDCGTLVDTTPDNAILSIGSVGTSTSNTTNTTTPYAADYRQFKAQYLVTAADMNAGGLSSGAITDLSFFVTQLNTSTGYDSFSISLGCTSQTTLSGSFSNSLLEVLPPTHISPNLGWSPHPFLHYFNWDGVSNIIVQVCYKLAASANSDYVAYTATAGNTVAYANSNSPIGSGCNLTGPTFSTNRPNMRFGIAAPNVLQYQWAPPTGDCDSCASVSVTVTRDTTYSLTVSDNGCVNSGSGTVTINPYIGTHVTPPFASSCNGAGSVQLNLSMTNPPSSTCLPVYTVTSVPYSSISGTATSIPLASFRGTGGGNNTDDGTAGPYNLNFSFPFYCNNYTQVWVNSNGWISLSNPYPGTTAALQRIPQTFPPVAADRNPLHEIALMVGDYEVSSAGQVAYFLSGTAPNRIFVVKFNSLPEWGSTATTTGEIHLYEGSGVVEIMLQSSNFSDDHTTGIKDNTGVGVAAPGRNNQLYTISTPEGWRFTPHNGPSAFIQGVVWTPNAGTLSNDTIVNPVATPTATTTYVADVAIVINQFTNPEVCHVRDSAIISVGNFPYSISATPSIACAGTSTQLSFNSPDSVISYLWTPGPPAVSNASIKDPLATVYDTTTFYVTAIDTNLCTVHDSVTVYTYPTPHPSLGRDTTICYTDSVVLGLPGSYGSYEWYIPGTAAPVATTPTVTAQPRSAYVLRLQDAASGCYFYTDTLQVDSFAHPALQVIASGPLAFCNGGNVVLESDPLYPNNLRWSNGSVLPAVPVTANGNFSYIATDNHNCVRYSDTAHVVISSPPAIVYDRFKPAICASESDSIVVHTVPANVPVTWSQVGGPVLASGDTFITSTPGSYQIRASQGCPTDSFFTLIVAAGPQIDTLHSASVCSCVPDYVVMASATSASLPVGYAWSNGSINPDLHVDVLGTNSYTLTVTDASSCTASASVTVSISCFEVHAVAVPDSVFTGQSFAMLDSPVHTGSIRYEWTPADSIFGNANQASVKATTFGGQPIDTFYLTAYDSATGCSATSFVQVYVIDHGGIAMANAFTPNGDRINDRMYPVVAIGTTVTEFRIYNRWGQTVYNDPHAPGWDGSFGGNAQPSDTYTYFVTTESPDPQDASKKITKSIEGSFQLFR